jgi:hypothetical protein
MSTCRPNPQLFSQDGQLTHYPNSGKIEPLRPSGGRGRARKGKGGHAAAPALPPRPRPARHPRPALRRAQLRKGEGGHFCRRCTLPRQTNGGVVHFGKNCRPPSPLWLGESPGGRGRGANVSARNVRGERVIGVLQGPCGGVAGRVRGRRGRARRWAWWRGAGAGVGGSVSGRHGGSMSAMAFHEKAGRSQVGSFVFSAAESATDAILPSALSVSAVRSVQVGRSRFSRRCHLIIDLPFHPQMKVEPGH